LLAKDGESDSSLPHEQDIPPWKIDEPLFLPPLVVDFVAKDHLACFVRSLVRDDLGLGEITGTYGSERGQPPFDPTMMTALLLYSYCCGIYSSRLVPTCCCRYVASRRAPRKPMAIEALLELVFNQTINSPKSFAGNVFRPTMIGVALANGAIGVKSFIRS
jgi:hypothetical protein